jgi:anti-sigma B factor antagonist
VDFFWRKTPTLASQASTPGMLVEHQGTQCHVSLSGRITIDSSPDLRLRLLLLLQSPHCQSLTVDFYDVGYIDTSGLAILVETLKAAREEGKTLHLSRLRERPRYLFESSRLLHLFDGANSQGSVSGLGSP